MSACKNVWIFKQNMTLLGIFILTLPDTPVPTPGTPNFDSEFPNDTKYIFIKFYFYNESFNYDIFIF